MSEDGWRNRRARSAPAVVAGVLGDLLVFCYLHDLWRLFGGVKRLRNIGVGIGSNHPRAATGSDWLVSRQV